MGIIVFDSPICTQYDLEVSSQTDKFWIQEISSFGAKFDF